MLGTCVSLNFIDDNISLRGAYLFDKHNLLYLICAKIVVLVVKGCDSNFEEDSHL